MPGTPQPVPMSIGIKDLPERPNLRKNAVHYEGDPGHIATAFQKSQQQEEHQHLGDKAQYRSNSGHNAVQKAAPAANLHNGCSPASFQAARGSPAPKRRNPPGPAPLPLDAAQITAVGHGDFFLHIAVVIVEIGGCGQTPSPPQGQVPAASSRSLKGVQTLPGSTYASAASS